MALISCHVNQVKSSLAVWFWDSERPDTSCCNWLVVLTILKNINGKDYPIYEMENKSHVWNHQPVVINGLYNPIKYRYKWWFSSPQTVNALHFPVHWRSPCRWSASPPASSPWPARRRSATRQWRLRGCGCAPGIIKILGKNGDFMGFYWDFTGILKVFKPTGKVGITWNNGISWDFIMVK